MGRMKSHVIIIQRKITLKRHDIKVKMLNQPNRIAMSQTKTAKPMSSYTFSRRFVTIEKCKQMLKALTY